MRSRRGLPNRTSPAVDARVPAHGAQPGPQTGECFWGAGGSRGLRGEAPGTSGARQHLSYEDDLVGLLHIPPELQEGRHLQRVVWLQWGREGGGSAEPAGSSWARSVPGCCTAPSPGPPGPPRSPALGGAEGRPAPALASSGFPGTARSTYVEVSGRRPGDADGPGLAALHDTPRRLHGEAPVLQGRDAVQAELHGLRAGEPLATRPGSAPGGTGCLPHPPSRPTRRSGEATWAGAAQVGQGPRGAGWAGAVLWSPSLGTAGWSGCSPPAARVWQVGPVCPCLAGCSPGSPGWASAPRPLAVEGLVGDCWGGAAADGAGGRGGRVLGEAPFARPALWGLTLSVLGVAGGDSGQGLHRHVQGVSALHEHHVLAGRALQQDLPGDFLGPGRGGLAT